MKDNNTVKHKSDEEIQYYTLVDISKGCAG